MSFTYIFYIGILLINWEAVSSLPNLSDLANSEEEFNSTELLDPVVRDGRSNYQENSPITQFSSSEVRSSRRGKSYGYSSRSSSDEAYDITVVKQLECPFPYKEVGEMCLTSNCNLTSFYAYDQARAYCQNFGNGGGDLVTFQDANEYRDIIIYLQQVDPLYTCNYWLGAALVSGSYQFVDGSFLPQTGPYWDVGQPTAMQTNVIFQKGASFYRLATLASAAATTTGAICRFDPGNVTFTQRVYPRKPPQFIPIPYPVKTSEEDHDGGGGGGGTGGGGSGTGTGTGTGSVSNVSVNLPASNFSTEQNANFQNTPVINIETHSHYVDSQPGIITIPSYLPPPQLPPDIDNNYYPNGNPYPHPYPQPTPGGGPYPQPPTPGGGTYPQPWPNVAYTPPIRKNSYPYHPTRTSGGLHNTSVNYNIQNVAHPHAHLHGHVPNTNSKSPNSHSQLQGQVPTRETNENAPQPHFQRQVPPRETNGNKSPPRSQAYVPNNEASGSTSPQHLQGHLLTHDINKNSPNPHLQRHVPASEIIDETSNSHLQGQVVARKTNGYVPQNRPQGHVPLQPSNSNLHYGKGGVRVNPHRAETKNTNAHIIETNPTPNTKHRYIISTGTMKTPMKAGMDEFQQRSKGSEFPKPPDPNDVLIQLDSLLNAIDKKYGNANNEEKRNDLPVPTRPLTKEEEAINLIKIMNELQTLIMKIESKGFGPINQERKRPSPSTNKLPNLI